MKSLTIRIIQKVEVNLHDFIEARRLEDALYLFLRLNLRETFPPTHAPRRRVSKAHCRTEIPKEIPNIGFDGSVLRLDRCWPGLSADGSLLDKTVCVPPLEAVLNRAPPFSKRNPEETPKCK